MECKFHVGQKVVYVGQESDWCPLKKGRVYTVSAVAPVHVFSSKNPDFFEGQEQYCDNIAIQVSEISFPIKSVGLVAPCIVACDFLPLHDAPQAVERLKVIARDPGKTITPEWEKVDG